MANYGKQMDTDVLIIGSGLSGLLLALELSTTSYRVLLTCKTDLSGSNTSFAQGGLAAVTGQQIDDSTMQHVQDTLLAGAGLCDENAVKAVVSGGQELVERLRHWGVDFDQTPEGHFELALEGGHGNRRVLHCKDTTGRSITAALIEKVKQLPNVTVIERACAVNLHVDGLWCRGASFLIDGQPVNINAGQVVLATGGLGQVYSRTTNPAVATGDGMAMAYRAGARLIDMEFVQFHPTALCHSGAPAFLISEAVRGAGALLVDSQGRRFARNFHDDGELATRDVVARGILAVMKDQALPAVGLDLSPIGQSMESRFPNIMSACRQWGIDPAKQPIPVSPAAHYSMGGIYTDLKGQTTVPGLYAIGECASIGLHGANRLASNSLLEAGVMPLRLARHLQTAGKYWVDDNAPVPTAMPVAVPHNLADFQKQMFAVVGLERNHSELNAFLSRASTNCTVQAVSGKEEIESANMLLLGQLIAQAALNRCESRGAHWRSDYPHRNDASFARRFYLSNNGDGWLTEVPTTVRHATIKSSSTKFIGAGR